jgi:alpha-galactosidase
LNHWASRVTDQTIRDTADAMVASGMRDAGYLYNIDDTWEGKATPTGIQPTKSFLT